MTRACEQKQTRTRAWVAATALLMAGLTGCGVDETPAGERLKSTEAQALTNYASYFIQAQSSQKCISVYGPSTNNNTDLVQYSCFGGSNQQWQLLPVGGYYQLRSSNFSGKCMAVSNATRTAAGYANNDPLVQFDCSANDNFLFSLVDVGGGYYEIKPKHTGKCVSVSGPSTADNQLMVQFDCFGGTNQRFRFIQPVSCQNTTVSHNMFSGPLSYTAPAGCKITGFSASSGQWSRWNSDGGGTYWQGCNDLSGGISNCTTPMSGLNAAQDAISCHYDDPYGDNRGTCTYNVTLAPK